MNGNRKLLHSVETNNFEILIFLTNQNSCRLLILQNQSYLAEVYFTTLRKSKVFRIRLPWETLGNNLLNDQQIILEVTKLTFTCSKSAIETLENTRKAPERRQ